MTTCNSCETHFNIGCFGHCDEIETGFVATEAGIHQIILNFLGTTRIVEVDLEIGDPINVPAGNFNDDSEAYFTIKMPGGDEFTHTSEAVDYTCFKTTIKLSF